MTGLKKQHAPRMPLFSVFPSLKHSERRQHISLPGSFQSSPDSCESTQHRRKSVLPVVIRGPAFMLNAAVAIDGFPLLLLLIGVRIAVCPFLLLLWPQLRVCHAHFIASLSAQAALAAVLFILAVFSLSVPYPLSAGKPELPYAYRRSVFASAAECRH